MNLVLPCLSIGLWWLTASDAPCNGSGFAPCFSEKDSAAIIGFVATPVLIVLWAVEMAMLAWLRRGPRGRPRPAIVEIIVAGCPTPILVGAVVLWLLSLP